MFKVWNVYVVQKGRRKGGPAYPGTDEFTKKIDWCETNINGAWSAHMGYFAFYKEADATAFRNVFGESKPEWA